MAAAFTVNPACHMEHKQWSINPFNYMEHKEWSTNPVCYMEHKHWSTNPAHYMEHKQWSTYPAHSMEHKVIHKSSLLYGAQQAFQSHLWTVTVMYERIFHPQWGYTKTPGYPNSPLPTGLTSSMPLSIQSLYQCLFSHAADICILLQEAHYLWSMYSYLPYHKT